MTRFAGFSESPDDDNDDDKDDDDDDDDGDDDNDDDDGGGWNVLFNQHWYNILQWKSGPFEVLLSTMSLLSRTFTTQNKDIFSYSFWYFPIVNFGGPPLKIEQK